MRSTAWTNSRPINGNTSASQPPFKEGFAQLFVTECYCCEIEYVNPADFVQYGNGSYTIVHSYDLI